MDDSSKTLHTDQLTAENLQMADINTQMINIDSVQQTIRQQALESESNGIESSVRELKRLPHETEGVQTCLHETSGARPRSLVQLLHIFDMSNEILREILEDVKGDFETMDDKYPSDGIESIQSLRLTCRRFCGISSPLLLHGLDVSLTASSLARLDEVSRHTTVFKRIRSVQVSAALYNHIPVRSL